MQCLASKTMSHVSSCVMIMSHVSAISHTGRSDNLLYHFLDNLLYNLRCAAAVLGDGTGFLCYVPNIIDVYYY